VVYYPPILPTKILCAFLISHKSDIYPYHPVRCDLIALTDPVFGEYHKL